MFVVHLYDYRNTRTRIGVRKTMSDKFRHLDDSEKARRTELRTALPRGPIRNDQREAACTVFRDNLKVLLRRDGRTMAKISELIGAPRQEWLRRIASEGLARRTRDNEERLRSLAQLLRIEPDDFWNPDLFVHLDNPLIDLASEDREKSIVWRKQVMYPTFEKLAYLLATRRFDFLQDLIESAYAAETKINPRRALDVKLALCRGCNLEFEEKDLGKFGVCSECGNY